MANPILSQMMKSNPINAKLGQMGQLLQMVKSNPQGMLANMMRSNPQFRQFVEQNRGKSPEQIAEAYGIDPSLLKNLM